MLLLLATALTPGAARAEADADRATARLLAEEGRKALLADDFTKAADRFRRADALLHAPTLQLGLALAEVGLGHFVAAQEIYRKIVREGAPVGASAAFTKAVEDARKELVALEPRVPVLTIEVEGASAPEVMLDGLLIPVAAIGVGRPVDPGRRLLRVTAPGKKPVELVLSLVEKGRLTVPVRLEDEGVAPPGPLTHPPPLPPVPPAAPQRAPAAESPAQLIAGVVGLAAGGAGLALGGIMGGLALAKHDELAAACPAGKCGLAVPQARIDEYATLGSVSTWGFVAGAALVVSGTILVVTAPRARAVGPAVVPAVGPNYWGLRATF